MTNISPIREIKPISFRYSGNGILKGHKYNNLARTVMGIAESIHAGYNAFVFNKKFNTGLEIRVQKTLNGDRIAYISVPGGDYCLYDYSGIYVLGSYENYRWNNNTLKFEPIILVQPDLINNVLPLTDYLIFNNVQTSKLTLGSNLFYSSPRISNLDTMNFRAHTNIDSAGVNGSLLKPTPILDGISNVINYLYETTPIGSISLNNATVQNQEFFLEDNAIGIFTIPTVTEPNVSGTATEVYKVIIDYAAVSSSIISIKLYKANIVDCYILNMSAESNINTHLVTSVDFDVSSYTSPQGHGTVYVDPTNTLSKVIEHEGVTQNINWNKIETVQIGLETVKIIKGVLLFRERIKVPWNAVNASLLASAAETNFTSEPLFSMGSIIRVLEITYNITDRILTCEEIDSGVTTNYSTFDIPAARYDMFLNDGRLYAPNYSGQGILDQYAVIGELHNTTYPIAAGYHNGTVNIAKVTYDYSVGGPALILGTGPLIATASYKSINDNTQGNPICPDGERYSACFIHETDITYHEGCGIPDYDVVFSDSYGELHRAQCVRSTGSGTKYQFEEVSSPYIALIQVSGDYVCQDTDTPPPYESLPPPVAPDAPPNFTHSETKIVNVLSTAVFNAVSIVKCDPNNRTYVFSALKQDITYSEIANLSDTYWLQYEYQIIPGTEGVSVIAATIEDCPGGELHKASAYAAFSASIIATSHTDYLNLGDIPDAWYSNTMGQYDNIVSGSTDIIINNVNVYTHNSANTVLNLEMFNPYNTSNNIYFDEVDTVPPAFNSIHRIIANSTYISAFHGGLISTGVTWYPYYDIIHPYLLSYMVSTTGSNVIKDALTPTYIYGSTYTTNSLQRIKLVDPAITTNYENEFLCDPEIHGAFTCFRQVTSTSIERDMLSHLVNVYPSNGVFQPSLRKGYIGATDVYIDTLGNKALYVFGSKGNLLDSDGYYLDPPDFAILVMNDTVYDINNPIVVTALGLPDYIHPMFCTTQI